MVHPSDDSLIPRLWAHRGSHRVAVENTLEAFRLAIAEGAVGVELDVRVTSDGAVVVVHDADLSRLGGQALEVASVPRAELPRIGGAPIPTLDEALDLILDAGLEVNVEIKAGAGAAAAVLRRRREADRVAIVVSAFDPSALEAIRNAVAVRTAFLFERVSSLVEREMQRASGLHPHYSACDAQRVATWRDAGCFVNAWTVNDPETARQLARWGVDGLVTDDIPAMREACRSQS